MFVDVNFYHFNKILLTVSVLSIQITSIQKKLLQKSKKCNDLTTKLKTTEDDLRTICNYTESLELRCKELEDKNELLMKELLKAEHIDQLRVIEIEGFRKMVHGQTYASTEETDEDDIELLASLCLDC